MSNNYVGYEYQDFTVKRDMTSMYADGLQCFGWEAEGNHPTISKPDSVVMKCKRDRKIRNKAELTRLQRQFDACVSDIQSLEFSKYVKSSAIAYIVGIVGTAFMAGSVFAVMAQMTVLCVILAIPAFVGWVLPYFLYRASVARKSAEVAPLIDQKYDEIYTVCEKASALLEA